METETLEKKKLKTFPSLRFGEFHDNWHKIKIQKLIEDNFIISHLDGNHGALYPRSEEFSVNGVPYITANDFVTGTLSFKNCKYLPQERAKKFKKGVARNGDVLFAHNATVGPVALLETQQEYVILSTTATYFRCNSKHLHNYFLKYLLSTENFVKQYSKVMSQSTRDQVPITIQRKFTLYLPSILEQNKIGTFLSVVDKKIQQLARKKKLLQTYKKGVMKQLFSQKLRFKDEEERNFPEWEVKKLKEFIKDFIVPMRDKPKDLTGEIPWCRIEDFNGKYLRKSKSNQGVTLETIKAMNLKIYPIDTLIVSCSANLGFCAIVKQELITNQTFIGLVPVSEKIDIDFLYHKMKYSSKRLNVLSSGTTISYLSRKQFENFKIDYPTLKEQQKIANFLSAIDKKIEAVSTQSEKSQQFKKGLLQQMFV